MMHGNMYLKTLQNMVIKRTNQSGGYGMIMGNTVSEAGMGRSKKSN